MITIKKISLIAFLCALTPTIMHCANNKSQSDVQEIFTKIKNAKNYLNKKYHEPVKPYIYNPVGFTSACLLSSIVGFKRIVATIVLSSAIVGSREIIQYYEKIEKNNAKP